MSSISRVMIWELWRQSRLELLGRVGYSSFAVVFVVMGIRATGEEIPSSMLASMILVCVSMSAVFSSSWLKIDSIGKGFDVQLCFTRPVSTRHFVLGRLTWCVATSLLCFLIPAVLFQTLSGIGLNLSSPLVVICSFVICATCAGWSSSKAVAQVVGVIGVCCVFIVATIAFCSSRLDQEPLLISLGKPGFLTFEWYQIVLLILVAVLSIRVCLSSVEAQRHGEQTRFGWTLKDGVACDSQSVVTPPLATNSVATNSVALNKMAASMLPAAEITAWKARIWRHWRQSGRTVMLVAIVLAIAVTSLVTGIQWHDARWKGGPALWMGTLVLSPIAFQIIAAELMVGLKRKPGMIELSVYDAVQPVRDDTIIATKLGLIAALSGLGWILMASAAAAQTALAGNVSDWLQVGETIGLQLNHMAWYDVLHGIAALASLFVIGSASMLNIGLLVSLSKDRYVVIVMYAFLTLAAIAALDLHYEWEIAWFWTCVKTIFGLTAAGGFCFGVTQCIVRRPFRASYGIFVAVISVTALTGLIRLFLFVRETVQIPISTTYVVLGAVNLAVGIVAALCLPPLALNLHRHR